MTGISQSGNPLSAFQTSVQFAKKFKVPFEVRSSFNNNRGTIVKEESEELVKVGPEIERIGAEVGAGEVLKQGGIAKLSVVGIGMRSHSGVAATLFECLGNGGVNIQMISTSEIKIAVILDESQIDHAAKLAHAAFGLAEGK